MLIPNGSGRFSRVLLLGGTSEIGIAILSALCPDPAAEVILAGRDAQRIEAAGESLSRPVTVTGTPRLRPGAPSAWR
jgi:decaprenylphospho-beta-D-erythro-pentofuranosid-2-ulose 2-reductase